MTIPYLFLSKGNVLWLSAHLLLFLWASIVEMFKQIKQTFAGGKKGKGKSSAAASAAGIEDDDTYRDVKEKDLTKLQLAAWHGDFDQVTKCLKKKPAASDSLYKGR